MASNSATTIADIVGPIITGDWTNYEDDAMLEFANKVRKFHSLWNKPEGARAKFDEQIDRLHAIGKLTQVERLRKQRTTKDDDGPKVDPLVAALDEL